jgi:hypothetical protein
MRYTVRRSDERGKSDLGWLRSCFSFSFADYYDPAHMQFGALRVINDDWIAPGKGFGAHPHRDMEIVTIVTGGTLAHKDNTGSHAVLGPGGVQVMSAGKGIVHSEYNHSATEPLTLFQLWIMTAEKGIAPRHDEKVFPPQKNAIVTVAGPTAEDGALVIHQDATVAIGRYDARKEVTLPLAKGQGLYLLVVEGGMIVGEETLGIRDAIAITDAKKVTIRTTAPTVFLAITVPM